MTSTKSPIFRIPANAYAAARARQYAGAWAAALIIPLLAAIIAGFYDLRWWFVGLMGLFIIIPMVLTMAWLSITGSAAMAMLLRPQRWSFRSDRHLDIEFFRFDADEDSPAIEERTVAVSDYTAGSRYFCFKAAPGQSFNILLIPADLVPAEYLNFYTE